MRIVFILLAVGVCTLSACRECATEPEDGGSFPSVAPMWVMDVFPGRAPTHGLAHFQEQTFRPTGTSRSSSMRKQRPSRFVSSATDCRLSSCIESRGRKLSSSPEDWRDVVARQFSVRAVARCPYRSRQRSRW